MEEPHKKMEKEETKLSFESRTKGLIDELKSVCASYGLGNDGNDKR